ncbi:peptidoglycan-binding protein [Streptomyces sp. NPDC004111]|uniref:peptidoglycan-binding domain-containing protein n=1 Tax=Streptomyces sp. NPDC004111 TaxID=3364690 RepID=UPI00367D958B
MRSLLVEVRSSAFGLAGRVSTVLASARGRPVGDPPAVAPPGAEEESCGAPAESLGLDPVRARNWQSWLHALGQDAGPVDGQLSIRSWTAAQRAFRFEHDALDGIVGPRTVAGLQLHLTYWGGYRLVPDGIAGAATRGAFWDFNTPPPE